MDEERNKFDRARRLLSRVMARLVQQTFLRWKMYCRFERNVKELAAVVDPVADVLEKLPENRTPTDVQRLMPLVSKIEAYRGLHQLVRELLASYLQLAVLSDRTELPRGPGDNTCLFSIVYGSMTALMGDPADPALVNIKAFAANQCSSQISPEASSRRLHGDSVSRVLRSDSTFSLGAGGAPSGDSPKPPGTPKAVAGETSVGVVEQQQQQRRVQGAGIVKVQEGSGSVSGSVGQQQPLEQVSSRLWRTVIEVISKLTKLQKAQAIRELAAQHAAALEDMALSVAGRAAAAAGGKAAAAALAAATAGAGGGAKAGAAAIGMGVLPAAAAEEGYLRLLPALAALRTQVMVIRTGQSFSGRELLCQEEAGLVQDVGGHLDLPGRAVAAVVPKDSLVAVVFVSREVYHRAMAMQSEISVRRAVDCCCRLPFLRHTPLKELYRLSRHLQEATFQPGEVVLQQGRENGFIYFLVSGEVQVVLDLPDTSDPLVLAAAMAVLSGSKLTPHQAQALAAHASAGVAAAAPGVATGYGAGRPPRDSTSLTTVTTEGITTPPGGGVAAMAVAAAPPAAVATTASSVTGISGSQSLPSFGITRRIVLGRRGSGVVLGDDLLREKRLTVGVVATSRCVCLGVSPQRFTMCCDPLTLRLFHKLRIQHSATALFTDSLVQQEQRTALGAMFREAVLNQSYGPAALKRAEAPEPKAWKAPSVRPEEIAAPADQIFQQQPAHKTTATTITSSGASGGVGGGSSAASVSHHSGSSGGGGSGRATATSGGGSGSSGGVGPGAASSIGQTLQGGSGGSGGGSVVTGPLAPGAQATTNVGPPRLYGGLTVSLVQGLVGRVAESGSMVTFLQRIKASEADALALPGGSGGRDGQLGPRDLDLSQQMKGITAQPQKVYTDMHEAACMAVIKVELAPGQLDVRLDPLAQVLDDIVVQWSDLSHRCGVQLVRWRTHDFFLVTPLDTARTRGGKRSRIRVMADTLLSMAVEFRRIVAQNEIPHLSMCAGLAIGGLFSSYDSGHFLVHCSGQAYTAAQHLCKMACEESHWQGTLLVADAVAQALSRTHNMAFAAGGSVLVGAVGAAPGLPRTLASQPTGRSMTVTAGGEGEEDDEPVSQGTRPYYKRGGNGGGGSRRLLLNNSATSSTGHTSYFISVEPDASYLDNVLTYDGELYNNDLNSSANAAGSNCQNAIRTAPHAGAAMPSSLPHLHHHQSSAHTSHLHHPHPHHLLTQQPTGTHQQQRMMKRHLSASVSVMTSRTSISSVNEMNGGGGGGSPRSPPHHLRHTTMRLAPIGSTANSAEGGRELGAAQEGSMRYADMQYHNPQQTTRRATCQSEPRVSFHARHSLKRDSGDGERGRMEETGGSVNSAGLIPVGANGAAGTSSPQRVHTLYDDGSLNGKRDRTNGTALRLTSNANRRERIAAGSKMLYRQQLLQEVSQLRHQQQEESMQPQYRPLPQHYGHTGQEHMVHGRQMLPCASESGYASDVECSAIAQARTVWRSAGGNSSSCTTSPLRSNKAALQSQSPSAVSSPIPQYPAHVEQPPQPPLQLQGAVAQQTWQARVPHHLPLLPPQQETGEVQGSAPVVIAPQVLALDTTAPPSPPESLDPSVGPAANFGAERTEEIEFVQPMRLSLPGLPALPMRVSMDGLGGPTRVLVADGADLLSGSIAEQSQLPSARETHKQTRNPQPTAVVSRNPSFDPNLNRSPSPSLCPSPIMGLTDKGPLSPGRVRVVSPEDQRSPRAPSPGYVTAAVRAAEAEGETQDKGICGGADSWTASRPATVATIRGTGAVAPPGGASPDAAPAPVGNSAAAAAAAAAAPLLALPARPIGVPSRRAPLGTQRPASPYIPFSSVDPTSDAAVVARGGSPTPHTGPPGTAGTVTQVPKLVACNYGYLQITPKSRARSRNGSAVHRDGTGDSSGAPTSPEFMVTVLRNISTGVGGGYSRSQSANAFLESTAGLLHSASRPASMAPGSASGGSSVGGATAGILQSATDSLIDGGADGRGGNRRPPGSSLVTPTSPQSPSRIRVSAGGPVVINAALVSRQCSPPSPPATAVGSVPAGSSSGGGAAETGNRNSPSRRRGPSWQDLGSQRAAEQYAASLPLGLMSVSFSTAGLSRVPPLQRLLYLESLALSYNHLVGLASEQIMGLSQNLKVLTLVSADLDELPPDMGLLLPGLVELNLCSNRLVSLPPTIGSMTRLRSLSVAHNQLASLPSSLYTLATLEHLLLQYNRLTVIDEALGNLRQLQALDLGFNRITTLPNETTALGSCLTRLVIPYNQLQALPPGFLLSMSQLAVLVLDFNPHLAADPQLGGGRGSSKCVSGATTDTASEAAIGGPIRSRSPSRLTLSSVPSRGTAAGGAEGAGGTTVSASGVESPGTEHSMGTELSFAPMPDPTVPSPSDTTLGGASRSLGSLPEGLSVTTSVIVASTTALSNLLKASAAPGAAVPLPMSPLPPTPTSPAPSAGPMAPQMLPALRVLSLSAVQLLQVPSWLPAGLQVLDLSRNNLRRLPSWLCRRLAPSLAVLRLHTNRLESLPSEIRSMSQLQLLSLEENPIASPERIATPQGAGWAPEWLYRKKYRSRPEIMASLATEHTGLTGPVSGLPGSASTANFTAASAESSAITAGGFGGGGTAASKAGSGASASGAAASSSGGMVPTRSVRKGMLRDSNAAA